MEAVALDAAFREVEPSAVVPVVMAMEGHSWEGSAHRQNR